MQTRDGLTEDISPRYAGQTTIDSHVPRHYTAARRAGAVALGWAIPGAGHLLLGRYGRALLFFATIAGSFVLGLALNGRLFWPVAADPIASSFPDLITILWFLAQVGSGLCYIVSYLAGFGTDPQPWAATYEYGNTFTFLAGLLNYLVVQDAFDIAAGRKH